MMFYPMISLWVLVPLAVIGLGWCAYQWWRNRKHSTSRRWIVRALIVLCIVGIALRPTVSGGSGTAGAANVDIYLVVDTTSSMIAEDYKGQTARLEGVKADIASLVKAMAGARYSVLSFANETYTELPLTTDATAVQSAVNILYPEITYYANGSSISQPVETLKTTLKKAAETAPERQKFVYYFGDGEQTVDKAPGSFESLRPLIDGGGVFGYGTNQGGKMKEVVGYDTGKAPTYVQDRSDTTTYKYFDAVSKIDEAALEKIASELGVPYVYAGTGADVNAVVAQIDFSKLTATDRDLSLREDVYWILAIVLVLLFAWETWALRKTLTSVRKPGGRKS
jgi:Ca-activated chloride channel family protein